MKTESLLTGSVGLLSTAVVESASMADLTTTIVQVVIGILTIIKLLKPQKDGTAKTNKNNRD